MNYLTTQYHPGRKQEINIDSQESAGKRRAKRCLKVNNTAFDHRLTGASTYFLAYKSTSNKQKHLVEIVKIKSALIDLN